VKQFTISDVRNARDLASELHNEGRDREAFLTSRVQSSTCITSFICSAKLVCKVRRKGLPGSSKIGDSDATATPPSECRAREARDRGEDLNAGRQICEAEINLTLQQEPICVDTISVLVSREDRRGQRFCFGAGTPVVGIGRHRGNVGVGGGRRA
jgi:hypothetical protein